MIRDCFAVLGKIFTKHLHGITRDGLIHPPYLLCLHRESSVFYARLVSIQLTCFVVRKVVQWYKCGKIVPKFQKQTGSILHTHDEMKSFYSPCT